MKYYTIMARKIGIINNNDKEPLMFCEHKIGTWHQITPRWTEIIQEADLKDVIRYMLVEGERFFANPQEIKKCEKCQLICRCDVINNMQKWSNSNVDEIGTCKRCENMWDKSCKICGKRNTLSCNITVDSPNNFNRLYHPYIEESYRDLLYVFPPNFMPEICRFCLAMKYGILKNFQKCEKCNKYFHKVKTSIEAEKSIKEICNQKYRMDINNRYKYKIEKLVDTLVDSIYCTDCSKMTEENDCFIVHPSYSDFFKKYNDYTMTEKDNECSKMTKENDCAMTEENNKCPKIVEKEDEWCNYSF